MPIVGMLFAAPLGAQQHWPGRERLEAERCTPASGAGTEWVERAARATGLASINGALRFTATESEAQAFQSDRMYPPFIGTSNTAEFTFDPATGAERIRTLVPGGGKGRDLVRTARALFAVRDTTLVPAAGGYRFFEAGRALNPLAVLSDWRSADVAIVGRCTFRDYPRVVLSRGTPGERLYLDLKSAVPVKYERMEPNLLWGQVRAEYVYATWWQAGSTILPVVAVRYLDGVEQHRRDLSLPQTAAQSLATIVPVSAAFPMPLPDPLPDHSAGPDFTQRETPVDTIRVSATTVLLSTPAYTHAVTLVGDTVYLMDATTAEWRSRADSSWIAKLFPTHRALVLVVTDLAWPHISGVRFWVARGATIATHRLSQPFLKQVITRKWTLSLDALERARPVAARLKWILVDSAAALAGGRIQLRPIDGVASEGALLAMLPEAGLLWAGDYIQSTDTPSLYAREVMAAVERAGFTPSQTAAQHLSLTPWLKVTAANPP